MQGPLGRGVDGTLALYTYTDVYHDKNGRHETNYPSPSSLADLPNRPRTCRSLYCNRKSGFSGLEGLEDAFRRNERVKLESGELDDRYEIFAAKDQDPNWLRQLFSPTFIVWLAEETPEKFAFELVDGILCCNVKGHKKNAAELDAIREAAAAVARRLRGEALEVASPADVLEAGQQPVAVGDQAGGDHQQHRGHQDQGDDELDLRRGAGRALLDPAALVAPQGGWPGAGAGRRAVSRAPRALDRGDRARQLGAGRRARAAERGRGPAARRSRPRPPRPELAASGPSPTARARRARRRRCGRRPR